MDKTKKLLEEGDDLGKPIGLTQADEMIKEFVTLNAITEKTVRATGTSKFEKDQAIRATELKNATHNAFIFSRSLINRFFEGPEQAEFLLVVLGAHKEAETVEGITFPAGSLTVLTAGCNKQVSPNGEVTFHPLNILEPANEYPPRKVMSHLGDDKPGSKSFFLLTE